MAIRQKLPSDQHVERKNLKKLSEALMDLYDTVSIVERRQASFLLQGLAFYPCCDHALVVLQAATLMARPAEADHLRVTVVPGTLSVWISYDRAYACLLTL